MKTCVLVPTYNHWQRLAALVAKVQALGLPVYLIDDGSGPECRAELARIASLPGVTLITLPHNGGKGVAVCTGLRQAAADGFSHAVQIDADGQHAARHLPEFLAMSAQYPEAVISGFRPYEQMSPGRARGRKLTDVMVCIDTLSRAIRDSMCGYRLYPLMATLRLLEQQAVGRRMDFDTDMIVRLYWAGVDVRHVTIDVVYDPCITSNFDMLGDNVRMTVMHIRHLLGMLLRIPALLRRRQA